MPGLVAEGRSIVEAVEIAQGLTRKIAESCSGARRSAPALIVALGGRRDQRPHRPRGDFLMGRLAGFIG